MKDKINVLIDTDIGDDIDDAFAILLAVKSKRLNIAGITTVYRNTIQRAQIVRQLLKKLNCFNIEVCAGIDEPFSEPIKLQPFENMNNNGKIQIPHFMPSMEKEDYCHEDVADFIEKHVQTQQNELTLLALGPLTNIAVWIKKYPDSIKRIKELVIMGGSYNYTRKEWNFRCDPEAAEIVMNSNIKIKLVPIDVTEKCILGQHMIDQFYKSQDEGVLLVTAMMDKYLKDFEYTRPVCLHDPLTLASMIDDFCVFKRYDCKVMTDKDCRGSVKMVSDDNGNVQVAKAAYINHFLQYMLDCCLHQSA